MPRSRIEDIVSVFRKSKKDKKRSRRKTLTSIAVVSGLGGAAYAVSPKGKEHRARLSESDRLAAYRQQVAARVEAFTPSRTTGTRTDSGVADKS